MKKLLPEVYKNYRILLASQSPRRQYLLREVAIDFEVAPVIDIKEDFPQTLKRGKIPIYLAKLKADAYASLLDKKTIVITADTIVWHKGKVLGKPADRNEAIQMLKKLSGCKHVVYTGVCIKSLTKEITFVAKSSVYFDEISKPEIEHYIDTYKPYDKAGAYGVQEWIGYVAVKKIKGSFYNVMGFPIHQVYIELKKFLND
jgi:septum formation protein